MASILTQAEADELIEMLKKTVEERVVFPQIKGKAIFTVTGTNRENEFIVNIDRKRPDGSGCTYQGRVKQTNQVLMRLDVNPTSVHINRGTGEKITGTHLHIYSEEYGMSFAIPFDVNNKDLYQLCYTFFEKFNIIEPPTIFGQCTL